MLSNLIARLVRIDLYPIKSMDGVSVNKVRVTDPGGLELDRRWRLVRTDTNKLVNAKIEPKLHEIRLVWNTDGSFSETLTVQLQSVVSGHGVPYRVAELEGAVADRISEYLGYQVRIEEEPKGGFPDDPDAPGPTVISTPTLQLVADHFGITLDDARSRFRTNLEVDAPQMPPFWEDLLIPEKGGGVDFSISGVPFVGTKPCQRCAVPTRDPKTGEVRRGFQKEMAKLREQLLPEWAPKSPFNHFFRLAVNTTVGVLPSVAMLQVGDEVVRGV